jgi:hypothetical protein
MLESALLTHYTTKPGMFKAPIRVTEARQLVKNIFGISNTKAMSDLDVSDVIINVEDNVINSGKLVYIEDKNLYRTA